MNEYGESEIANFFYRLGYSSELYCDMYRSFNISI
jgi:hypothetical protein